MRDMTPKTDAELATITEGWKAGHARAAQRAKEGRGMPAAFHERMARAYRQVGDAKNAEAAERMAREAR